MALLPAGAGAQTPTPRTAAPVSPDELVTKKRLAVPKNARNWTPPRTAWGDPDIAGVFTNSDESGIPFERPAEFEGRRLEDVSPAELAEMVKQRQKQAIERAPTLSEFPGATSPMHWFENYGAVNSRAWLVSDPPDGKVPPVTAEGQARAAARAAARGAHGPADSWEDRSYYDRCITRGLPGSMMPAIYGNSYRVVQSQGYVSIQYEMIHETRVIPVDAHPHAGRKIRLDMGDARGHWEGDTLVVETTNFRNRSAFRNADAETLTIVERFTRTAPDQVRWTVTVTDPATWTWPWTFSMPLTMNDSEPMMLYECHEGNYGLRNILSAARAQERAAGQ
jgi:hypothetical protein